ncbi:MAG: dTMP kinase [Methanobrevibacter boviskoreani]|jgi:dTMP kinase|uniref:dTMP kinase n=1 Tax=Methanobrevibacter boviskoreani TaxID=1348249 RepID=UPI00059376AA|nr:dTMP kinase [Methanobrevibacter boviskoreani]MCI6774644.1 dTMP kinase [Methanobrevibacter boviskoreani]MCI6931316.1 dTMP kinase [Methanobrevibacter boviskoreani]MDD6256923.1 dTMP kinase [Methanobrevibacter boviskoreani]MDY5614160.1 dTMP kinase [Methanobrevibacter boviskoreani]
MYIVFEGIDGAGKTTQIELLKDWLVNNGFQVETVVEPTDSDIGKLIRKLLQDENATSEYMQKTLGLLFAADRTLLMNDIESFQKENKVVISDRSFYSSLVYQEPADWIEEINKFAKIPDMVILLDLDLKTSVSRTEGKDEFENEEFLSSVKDKYLELADKHDNFTVIDGNSGPKMVAHNIKIKVAPLLGICKDCITD